MIVLFVHELVYINTYKNHTFHVWLIAEFLGYHRKSLMVYLWVTHSYLINGKKTPLASEHKIKWWNGNKLIQRLTAQTLGRARWWQSIVQQWEKYSISMLGYSHKYMWNKIISVSVDSFLGYSLISLNFSVTYFHIGWHCIFIYGY